jgi:hypothetical protein
MHNTHSSVHEAMQGVHDALQYAQEYVQDLVDELEPRIWFHLKWGLEKVEFTIANDFTRLWDVLDERTLAHVTTGFYQDTALFRTSMNDSVYSESQNQRETIHEINKVMWQRRKLLLQRAINNITLINAAYTTGTPDFVYKKSYERMFDKEWIPYDILTHESTRNEYFEKFERYIDLLVHRIDVLSAINDEVFLNV